MVIPIGYTGQGLPIGVQIAGKRWHGMELLEVAAMLDKAAGVHRAPPALMPGRLIQPDNPSCDPREALVHKRCEIEED